MYLVGLYLTTASIFLCFNFLLHTLAEQLFAYVTKRDRFNIKFENILKRQRSTYLYNISWIY